MERVLIGGGRGGGRAVLALADAKSIIGAGAARLMLRTKG